MRVLRSIGLCVVGCAWLLSGCDRNIEPFVPGEEPRLPDLARIFPAGAESEEAGLGAAGGSPAPGIAPAPRFVPNDASAGIRGTIEISADLAGDAPPGGVLFLIARGAAGGPPLAARRYPQPRFPLSFEIGPENVMIPSRPLEGAIALSARLDGDGNAATRLAGDLQGAVPESLGPGARGVTLVLDERL